VERWQRPRRERRLFRQKGPL